MPTGNEKPSRRARPGEKPARTSARGTPAPRGERGPRSAPAAKRPPRGSTGKKPEHVRVVLLDADEVRQIVKAFGGKYLAFKVVVEPPRPTARARKLMKDAGDGSAKGKPDREETTLIVALAPSRPGTE